MAPIPVNHMSAPSIFSISMQNALVAWFAARGEKPFRARQVHALDASARGCDDFDAMTDVAKSCAPAFRSRLRSRACRSCATRCQSDGTRKWLLDVGNGNAVETVFIPESDRGTLCVSSQAGVRSIARSAPPASRASTAISALARSSASCGWPIACSGATRPRPVTTGLGDARATAGHQQRGDDGHGRAAANFDNVVTALRLMLDDMPTACRGGG
jgi:23S rRNA (adenine2503-C2)-methyltransferase